MTESRGTVLIIEDDDSLRPIVARYLRGKRFGVAEAVSAEEATALVDEGLHPDAVLLDVNLPGDTGWDLLRGPALRGSDAPPVLITSAGAVSPRKLAEFQCAGWLPKPYPLETLVDTLDRLISQRAGATEL